MLSKKLELISQKLSPRHRQIASNTGWLLVDRIVRTGIGLFIGVWMARYLGPEQFGLYNYAIAFVSLFIALATLGLDRIVVRDIVREPSCKNEILGTTFVLKFIGGVLALFLSVGAIFLLRPDDSLSLWLVGITAAGTIFQAFDTVDLWFQSQVQSKYAVYAKSTAFLLITLVRVTLLRTQAFLTAFAWAGLAEIASGGVCLAIVYRMNGYLFQSWKVSLPRAKSLLNDSWPLILSGFAIYVQARIDQVMLGEMIGDLEVGRYSAAMRLIEAFGFIPIIIQNSIAPYVTEAKAQSETAYYTILLNIYRLMFILFLITSVPIFLFSRQLVILSFGSEYEGSAILLSLFSIRLFFTNFGVAKSLFITNENLFKYSLITATIGALVNITFNYLLIPIYASVGAIWATIISFTVTIFFVDLFYYRVRKNLWLMLLAVATPWKLNLK